VGAHVLPLRGVERAGLEQHRVADADLADVVEERRELQRLHPLLGIPALARQRERERGHAAAMALGVRVLRLDRLGEPEQRLAVRGLELEVALLELLGALAHDDVEELLALLQLVVLEAELLDELALLVLEAVGLEALGDDGGRPAALPPPA